MSVKQDLKKKAKELIDMLNHEVKVTDIVAVGIVDWLRDETDSDVVG